MSEVRIADSWLRMTTQHRGSVVIEMHWARCLETQPCHLDCSQCCKGKAPVVSLHTLSLSASPRQSESGRWRPTAFSPGVGYLSFRTVCCCHDELQSSSCLSISWVRLICPDANPRVNWVLHGAVSHIYQKTLGCMASFSKTYFLNAWNIGIVLYIPLRPPSECSTAENHSAPWNTTHQGTTLCWHS